MKKNKVITKNDLRHIVHLAQNNFLNLSAGELNNSEFVAKCYLEACASFLGLKDYEYEEKIPYSPADE